MILTYTKYFYYPLDFNQNNSNSLSNITWTLTDIFMTRCLQNTTTIPVVVLSVTWFLPYAKHQQESTVIVQNVFKILFCESFEV